METKPIIRRALTTAEIADLFGVSVGTIRSWTRRGLLPAVTIGTKTRRYDPGVIERMLRDGGPCITSRTTAANVA